VDRGTGRLRDTLEGALWPLVETYLGAHDVAGLAVAVVREDEVATRGFGVRDVGSGAPVTSETMFHLASVSKPFVATAVVSLSTTPDAGGPVLDLDAPITDWVPELTLADGRSGEVTARGLLSHTSGLPDVTDYGWHAPQLGDEALSELARSMSGWRLQAEPGSTFSYSNAGFELLGLLLSRVVGTTFEDAVRRQVLTPLGMRDSTFLRADVPPHLAASPHVGMPLAVPGDAYPYTRRHAPSSTLHSNLDEMCRWMLAHLEPAEVAAGRSDGQWARLDAELRDLMWRPVVSVGRPPWEEAAALGWAMGSYGGHRTFSHSGTDPGFGSMLVLVPERRTGVVVLANSNTAHVWTVAKAALDVALADVRRSKVPVEPPEVPGEGETALRSLLLPVVGPVAETLARSGPVAATSVFHRLAAVEPPEHDLDDDGFVDAVWGAIELHRTDLVWPILRLWIELRPESSDTWTMSGWAHQVDGDLDQARAHLGRALDTDPENDEAAAIMSGLPRT
jgi:CubicO group peptidase (beta-lactamase class C family)